MTPITRSRLLPVLAAAAGAVILGVIAVVTLGPHAGTGTAAVGGPFVLTAQDGKPVTERVLRGQPTMVFFGYTHCPDVCPATLAEISAVFKAMGPDPKAKALFITVDPERDTPAVLKDYLTSFDPRITGLTGSPDAIHQVEIAYKAYAKAVPDKDGTYTMDHTAITYLMDKNGNFIGALNLERPAKEVAEELKQYF
jgi:protein SCO1/2